MLFLHPAQLRNLVPVASGMLEVHALGGAFHALLQGFKNLAAAPLQKKDAQRHVLLVGVGVDQANAWAAAALNLVLQAGPGAVLEEALVTLADANSFCRMLRLSRTALAEGKGPK